MNLGVTLQLWYYVASSFDEPESPIHACGHWASFFLAHLTLSCLLSVHSHYLLRYKKWRYTMPYIFVRCDVSHLDDCNPFDATRWGHDKTTYIDFQLVKDRNDRTPWSQRARVWSEKALLPNVLVSVSTTCSVQRAGNPRWLQSHCSKHHQGDICVDTA